MQTRLRIATAATCLLVAGPASLLFAGPSNAAPTPSASPTAPAPPQPRSSEPAPLSPSTPEVRATAVPSRPPVASPSAGSGPTRPGSIEVPAGNVGITRSTEGSDEGSVILLIAAGGLLVAGGATLAIRRRS